MLHHSFCDINKLKLIDVEEPWKSFKSVYDYCREAHMYDAYFYGDIPADPENPFEELELQDYDYIQQLWADLVVQLPVHDNVTRFEDPD